MLDEENCVYIIGERKIPLTKGETELLSDLILNKHRFVTINELAMYVLGDPDRVWGLKHIMQTLREKLHGEIRLEVKYSRGYRIRYIGGE